MANFMNPFLLCPVFLQKVSNRSACSFGSTKRNCLQLLLSHFLLALFFASDTGEIFIAPLSKLV